MLLQLFYSSVFYFRKLCNTSSELAYLLREIDVIVCVIGRRNDCAGVMT